MTGEELGATKFGGIATPVDLPDMIAEVVLSPSGSTQGRWGLAPRADHLRAETRANRVNYIEKKKQEAAFARETHQLGH